LQHFIRNHLHADVHQLALQAKRYPDVDMAFAVRQISGRQKICRKVPSFYANDEIIYPQSLSLEQASSEITAQYKASLISTATERSRSIVDLTGGFGIDSFFISRKFEQAFYVEKQTELCEIAQHNFTALQAHNITVVNDCAENYLNLMPAVDCIFIDPARRSGSGKKLVFLSDCEPNVQTLAPQLLEKAETVLIKLSPMFDIWQAKNKIPQTCEIHILAIENECKEILLVLKNEKPDDISIKSVNFLNASTSLNNCAQVFEYQLFQETNAQVKFASKLKKYLYEPNAAIMKSGGFKTISQHYNIEKLHPNTHLYTSDEWIPDFAGRAFEIFGLWTEKKLKKHTERIQKANISVRNYPIGADELRKKLKICDGGDCYLFACTLRDSEKVIVECRKKKHTDDAD
jgi:16S rRNA G966 N2-methylase RsmD